jgi:hypothetical protein
MPTLVDLSAAEKESVSKAIGLVKAAGWKDKAKKLQGALDDDKIHVDVDMKATHGAEAFPGKGSVNISPRTTMSKGNPAKSLGANDPDYVNLAMILMHEADHLLGHGEIEAYGETISFLEEMNENFEKYFPGASKDDKIDIELWKRQMEDYLKKMRRKYIDDLEWEKKP